jgi:mitochondrial fission protein ELM1
LMLITSDIDIFDVIMISRHRCVHCQEDGSQYSVSQSLSTRASKQVQTAPNLIPSHRSTVAAPIAGSKGSFSSAR